MVVRVIAVAGASGSGKTTVAEEIALHYGKENCLTLSADNYYRELSEAKLEAAEHSAMNFDHPDSIDFSLLATHLNLLKHGQDLEIPDYDFATHKRRTEWISVQSKPIIIVEGILVLAAQELSHLLDLKIYVKADLDECFIRRLQRDMKVRKRECDGVITQYRSTVKPMFKTFVEPCEAVANLVVINNEANPNIDVQPVIDILKRIDRQEHLTLPDRVISLFSKGARAAAHIQVLPLLNEAETSLNPV